MLGMLEMFISNGQLSSHRGGQIPSGVSNNITSALSPKQTNHMAQTMNSGIPLDPLGKTSVKTSEFQMNSIENSL